MCSLQRRGGGDQSPIPQLSIAQHATNSRVARIWRLRGVHRLTLTYCSRKNTHTPLYRCVRARPIRSLQTNRILPDNDDTTPAAEVLASSNRPPGLSGRYTSIEGCLSPESDREHIDRGVSLPVSRPLCRYPTHIDASTLPSRLNLQNEEYSQLLVKIPCHR
jgi:hypothetical protein